jgi:signal transduction histidine kinase
MVLRWRIENVRGLDNFPPEQSLHILRIIQEAVTNVILHAKASEVSVDIRAGGARSDVLAIQIRDDGQGFPPDGVPQGRGIGNMKSRARALGAELRFDSEDAGTLIELRVPIPR